MSGSILITIDIPPRILSPNGSGHWTKKGAAKKAQRTQGFVLAREQMCEKQLERLPWPKARVEMCWYAARPNWVPDAQNAVGCVKALIDGVADAGLFVNDKYLEWGRILREVDPELPRVVLLFEEIA